MSMYPRALGPIPEEMVRVARAACPKGTLAMRLRDALGAVYQDEQFAALFLVERATRLCSVAASGGHHPAIRREPQRSTSRQCGALTH